MPRRDGALVIRADTRAIPLPDQSVDLIVTSPPYFGQRSYKDGGEHYDGQVGDEAHPQEWLETMWDCMTEWWRVLKPEGSCFVNLGDKYAGSGAPGTTSGLSNASALNGGARERGGGRVQGERSGGLTSYTGAQFGRDKSKQMLPHRFAIGCEDGRADPDGIGWVMREDLVWWKKNGLPESVADRFRNQHEYVFHLTREGRYYAAMDELRAEAVTADRPGTRSSYAPGSASGSIGQDGEHTAKSDAGLPLHPMGSLPGSVLHLANEPLRIPDWLNVDHFAAYPTELPRRLILGFSPPAICLDCGKGRVPVVHREHEELKGNGSSGRSKAQDVGDDNARGWNGEEYPLLREHATILGHSCACTPRTEHAGTGEPSPTAGDDGRQGERPADIAATHRRVGPWTEYHLDGWVPPPSRPAVVLDPFSGTGTTIMVARALGRLGVGVDLSADYCRVAQWRVWSSGHGAKIASKRNAELQGSLGL